MWYTCENVLGKYLAILVSIQTSFGWGRSVFLKKQALAFANTKALHCCCVAIMPLNSYEAGGSFIIRVCPL